ncbi:MAG: PepSY domain-containing protein [Novosphingobium sp.]|nr:PepSY domain-containing protein [Novosphingobium sp.]
MAPLLQASSAMAAPPGQRPDPQGEARREMRAGTVQSLREIERRVLPTKQGMQYLGPEYDPTAMAYRLKFIRDGRVTFVDVDARTGEIIGESR